MAHKSPDAGNGAASGLHSEKSKAIAMDVKMQIRILEAVKAYLHYPVLLQILALMTIETVIPPREECDNPRD